MPLAERRERHASMMEVIRRNDVMAWHQRFVAALKEAATPSAGHWKDHPRQKAAPFH